MAFMTLNGVSVPTAAGGEVTLEDFGETVRTALGECIRDRRATKRHWRFRTPPISAADARAFRGLIEGSGLHIGFDGSSTAEPPVAASTFAAGADLVGAAADGNPMALLHTEPSGYSAIPAKGAGCLWTSRGTTNLLAADLRDCEGNPAGDFTAIGTDVAFSNETTCRFEGALSLQCVRGGAPGTGGWSTGTVAASASTAYTASVWLLALAANQSVRVYVVDSTTAETSKTFVLPANIWCRVWVKHTTAIGATTVALCVENGVSGTASTWYADALQIEALTHPTAWVDGVRAPGVNVRYPTHFLAGARGVTVACWCTPGHAAASAATSYAWELSRSTAYRLALAGTTTSRFTFVGVTDSVQTGNVSTSPDIVPGRVYHCVCTFDETLNIGQLYVDGTLKGTDTSFASSLGLRDGTLLSDGMSIAGRYASGSALNGICDEVLVLPYVANQAMVTGLYGAGTPPDVSLPRPWLSGDLVAGQAIRVVGEVRSEEILGTVQSSAWDSAARTLEFELAEA